MVGYHALSAASWNTKAALWRLNLPLIGVRRWQMLIKLTKKEANIIKYLASLKVDSPQYADVNQELTTILKKIAKVLDK